MANFPNVQERALSSQGQSNSSALYGLVKQIIFERNPRPPVLVDLGCGIGNLFDHLKEEIDHYIGVDVVKHGSMNHKKMEFHLIDSETGATNLPEKVAEVVCSIETIEHVENPRAFMREVVRLTKPGGLIVVTTPNQLSLLSKLCLILKNEFVHFQESPGLYPAHLSALLEVDLVRMAKENSLKNVEIKYSGEGRIPGTSRHWPRFLSSDQNWGRRMFSDNIILIGEKSI